MMNTKRDLGKADLTNEFNFFIGQVVEYDAVAHEGNIITSVVIGIDRYIMSAADGQRREWTSYTLRDVDKERDSPWSRWWAVNVPHLGAHFYKSVEGQGAYPPESALDSRLSGPFRVDSEGDAALSTGAGVLATYVTNDGIYAVETFFDEEKNTDQTARLNRLVFVGIKAEL